MSDSSPTPPVGAAHMPDLAAPAAPLWCSEREPALRCLLVRQESADVKSFVLAADAPRSFRYLPGQFITLELDVAGQRLSRCYTLSSTPTRPDTLAITVKRVPGGPVSNWLHDNLRAGMRVAASGPAGVFSCLHADAPAAPASCAGAQRLLFLSGGSGITPLMSMVRALHDLASAADVVFLHCARSPADVLFAHELPLLARGMQRLRLASVCERAAPDGGYLGYPGHAGHPGRIDGALLAQIAPDFLQRCIYTCGPAPFMAGVRALLAQAGFDMARYRQESFAFDTLEPPAAAAVSTATAGAAGGAATLHRIRLQKSGTEFACTSEQSILQAAQAAGLRIAYSCASGVCGTCKSRKISGQVRMAHAGGIRQREIDQGWILPCCSKPLSDVLLDR